MKLSLVGTQGKGAGKVIPITLPQFLIGRDPECQLRPGSPMISKRHCALLIRGDKVFLRDFGSTNGTQVNDEPVQGERELHNDDRLKVGPLIFVVRVERKPLTRTLAPPKAQAPAAKPEDDEAAAMLLDIGDSGDGSPAGVGSAEDVDSVTSTLMEMPAIPSEAGPSKPGDKKAEPGKPDKLTTSNAARAILEKFSKRGRS